MNTILIPTDFSETAKNAARYAIKLAESLDVKKIIIYNAYQKPVSGDPMMDAVELYDIQSFKKISEEGLLQFKNGLQAFCDPGIELTTISEFNILSSGVNEVCEENKVDLIVMGITGGGSGIEERLIGSNTIQIAKHTLVPVIIIPSEASFKPLNNIVLACDFKNVVETTPVDALKNILNATEARLFVLHVDQTNKPPSQETRFESLLLDTLLQGYHPEYHFISNPDFVDGINQFAVEKQADLIVAIPKKHGLFEGLFHRSNTKKLAFHTHVPLMVVHE